MKIAENNIIGEPIDLDLPVKDIHQDKKLIWNKIMIYFDSMYESNVIKVKQVFHPNAKITGYMSTTLVENTLDSYVEFIALQRPSAFECKEPKFLEILSVKVAGDTAVAIVRNGLMGKTFVDTLTFIKVNQDWLIYSKLYHIEA
jgi:hypothetical protein